MRLRPINAIFVDPKMKFIVVYQDGELWQLPRMKIDMDSWERREAYTGSDDSLYLSSDQEIADTHLAEIIPTKNDLPDNIQGVTLSKFKTWWLLNAYKWIKSDETQQKQAEATGTQLPVAPTNNKTQQSTNSQVTQPEENTPPQAMPTHNAPTSASLTANEIFDAMLADLDNL